MFPKGSISISLTVGNKVDLIKTHLCHLACKLVWFSGPIILSNLSRPRRKRKSSKGPEHSPTSSRWIIVWFANIINDQSKRVFFVAILDPTSMIREVPSSSPTSCMFHALLGVRRSFYFWSFIIHHVFFQYTHMWHICDIIWFYWQHLSFTIQSTSSFIIHRPHPTLSSWKMLTRFRDGLQPYQFIRYLSHPWRLEKSLQLLPSSASWLSEMFVDYSKRTFPFFQQLSSRSSTWSLLYKLEW